MGRKTAAAQVDEQLNRFIKRREQIKYQINKFCSFVENFCIENQSLSELSVRLDKIEPLFGELGEASVEIQVLDESRYDEEEINQIETTYFTAIALAKDLIKRFSIDEQSSLSTSAGNVTPGEGTQGLQSVACSSANLPRLGLPKFSGKYDKFTQFYETFQTLVDKNPSLNNIQKFYYLLDSLEGEASRVLECLEVTSVNYPVALDLLHNRFYNKPLIIQTHLKSLFDEPTVINGSHKALQSFVDGIEKHTRALKALGEPIDTWDRLIIFFMTKKLDIETKKDWEEKSLSEFSGNPQLKQFIDFLSSKARVLSTIDFTSKTIRSSNRNSYINKGTYTVVGGESSHSSENNSKLVCEFCKGSHYVYFCEKLLALPVEQRLDQVKKKRLCLKCLRSSHQVNTCRSSNCRKCHNKHNTLLHFERKNTNSPQETLVCIDSGNETVVDDQFIAATSVAKQKVNQIILSTAVVQIKDSKDQFVPCRALLDSGSQINFISQNLAKQLGLPGENIKMPISGIGEIHTDINRQVTTTIKSSCNSYRVNLPFFILENITANIPSTSFDSTVLNIPSNLKLADPQFDQSSKIDMLLGAGVFYDLLCVGQIRLGRRKPILQKTVFGWIISGPLYSATENDLNNRFSCHLAIQDVQDQLERFWVVEEFTAKKISSQSELECENIFSATTIRDQTGRFCVRLPVTEQINHLGDTLEIAQNRFYSLERKFKKDPSLKQKYSDFIEEYRRLNHMSKIPTNEIDSKNKVYYLPHHAVINEASSTTRLRVVFDASAKSSTGVSLNDGLLIGPTVQDELFEILLRFRQFEVVLTADIEKMYRQVNIVPEQRDLQRILWRKDASEPFDHFRLHTLTYGTAPASFLATRCLNQIADDIREQFPKLSRVISKCFYMDDLILVTPSIREAIEAGKALEALLEQYGFPLRKWCSNKDEVMHAFTSEVENDVPGYFIGDDSNTKKTLGLFWQANLDKLKYMIKRKSESPSITKRSILSIVSQIFDPLGLVGPVVVQAKLILQKLWLLKLEWDESVPTEIFTAWTTFYSQLDTLHEIIIPRQVLVKDSKYVEMHGFCDASESAYGACLYLRSVSETGNYVVQLVCSKSRVAPLKSISLPRLELCGAVLLARLTDKVLKAIDIDQVFYWTDSTIVLSWLAEEPCSWKIFVANRTTEIQRLTKVHQWGHVSSADNPADIISRGASPVQLRNLSSWWHGPSWLLQSQDSWPKFDFIKIQNPIEKRKRNLALVATVSESQESIFFLKSSLFSLLKATGWCMRFYNNLKLDKLNRNYNKKLSVDEIDEALLRLIKIAQKEEFSVEIEALKNNKLLPKSSKLKSLDPFYHNGLLLVGGRIGQSDESFSVKHPIILQKKHRFTRLVIEDQHHKQLHAGAQAILATLRGRFWILDGRNEVRGVLSKCRTCFRARPTTLNQKMSSLPRDRVVPLRPFYICGVDFAGPFNVKDGKLRNRSIIKGYMCLFVCFSTKAVHIELVSDLSTDSFLDCLKRFVSRRGLCKRIYSDNGSNFIGACNELKRVLENLTSVCNDKVFHNYCLQNGIEWKFIAARSPHQGGLWESAIKSAKYHVTRIIGNRNLTFESLSTIFAQVEAVLNSRPITPLSCDPNDFQVLTPGHFIIGDALNALPQSDVANVPSNRLKHYHLLQQIVQHMWKRWSSEYLTTLQQRSKWQSSSENIKVGSMVILKDETCPPLHWKLGRIAAVHPGSDGLVRVVSVKTINGVVRRAVQKICILPMEDSFA